MGRRKRHRGAQPGNQNARKHGFYATKLNPEETLRFWTTVNVQGIDPNVLALRMKIHNALLNAPDNTRILLEISRLLAKLYYAQEDMTDSQYTEFKKMLRYIIKAAATGDEKLTEQIISKCLKRAENL